MIRWKARARLVVLAAVCMAAGIVVPFVPRDVRTDILAGGLFLGGLAMLVVALVRDPSIRDQDDGEDGDSAE
jgi:hypothetical protein